jgi:hypothetical protein
MMKALIKDVGLRRQQITNMERLAPGFAEPAAETGLASWAALGFEGVDPAAPVTLVLARNHRAFTDWFDGVCSRDGVPKHLVRYVAGVQDLRGIRLGVQVVLLPDWHLSMSFEVGQEVERELRHLAALRPSAATPAARAADVPWVPGESGPLAGRNASGRKVPPTSPTGSAISRSTVITVESVHRQGDAVGAPGLMRVRVGRTKERKGSVGGDPLDVVTTQYLDGKAIRVASTRQYFQEDEVAFDAVPVRTKDITDFGRLTTAAKALAVSMAPYGPNNEPSPAQLAVFINGYRNLLEWRRKVRQQITRAEGEIDVVETLLTQIL